MLQVISKMAESFRKNNSNETELFQNIENFGHSVKECVDVQEASPHQGCKRQISQFSNNGDF